MNVEAAGGLKEWKSRSFEKARLECLKIARSTGQRQGRDGQLVVARQKRQTMEGALLTETEDEARGKE